MQIKQVWGRPEAGEAVDAALDATARGAVALVIQGEAGIGRSTVWEHAVGQAHEREWRVLSCRPGEVDRALSFAGLVDLFEGVADAFGDLPAPQAAALQVALLRAQPDGPPPDHHAVCLAVLSLVRLLAVTGPVILAIDDAQWLDAASATVVTYLARRIGGERVGLLVSVRSRDHRDETVPFGLDQVFGDDLRRIRLGPLAPADLRRLVRARTGLALSRPDLRRLDQVSGGNPLLALEISRILARDGLPQPGVPLPVPPAWAEAAAARMDELPAEAGPALLYVAALDAPTTDLVRAALPVSGPVTPGLAAAEENGIVEVAAGRIRFTHPTYASAVYLAAGSERRRHAHQRLAEVVGDPELEARHLALATDTVDAAVADRLDGAARSAWRRGSTVVAAELWDLAARRTPADGPLRHRRAVAGAACLFSLGDIEPARGILREAVAALPPGRDQAYALLWLAPVLAHTGSPRDAVAALRRGLAMVGDDRLLAARLQLRIAYLAEHDNDLRLTCARTALALLDDIDPQCTDDTVAVPTLRAAATIALGYLGFLAGHGLDRALLEQASTLLPPGDTAWEVHCGRLLLTAWISQVDLRHPLDGWPAIHQRATGAGDEPTRAVALLHLVELECWRGDWRLAAEYAGQLAGAAAEGEPVAEGEPGRWSGLALYATALPAALSGAVDVAVRAATDGLRLADRTGDPVAGARHRGVLGFLELSRENAEAADRHLSEAAALVSRMGLREPAGYRFHGDHIAAVLALGDLDRARVLLGELNRRTAAAPYPWLIAVSARCRAQVAMAGGDLDGAAAAARAALRAHAALPMPFELARTHLVQGQILRRAKQKLAAQRTLHEAERLFTELGAPLWSQLVAAELHRLGLRRGSPDELTPTEEQVVRLVLDGRANDEVAAALYISHRTVENHLSRIYRKMGVRSRTELMRTMAATERTR